MSEIREIDDLSFETEVLASEAPFLLSFSATWCGPCKALTPLLEALATEAQGTLSVGKLDVDSSPATAARYSIRAAPTLVLFHGGRELKRRVGSGNKQTLSALLEVAKATASATST